MSDENSNESPYTHEELARAAERGVVVAAVAVKDLSSNQNELLNEAVMVALEVMFEEGSPLQQSQDTRLQEMFGEGGRDFMKSYMRRILHDRVREALAAKEEKKNWKM